MKTRTKVVTFISLVVTFTNCTKKPIACVDNASKSGTAGVAISFDASCSENASQYHWEFGDGATGHAAAASHVYNNSGTYTAKIRVESENGKKEDEKTVTVTVN